MYSQSGPVSRSSVQDRIHIARQAQNVQQAMLQRQQQQYNWQQSTAPQQFQQFSEIGHQGVPYQQYNQYPIIHDFGHFDGGSGDFADKHLVSQLNFKKDFTV
jgi:hypothetical protein